MKDKKHIKHIKTLPCIVCFADGGYAHHVRNGYNAGVGCKPDDKYTLPMCRYDHSQLHAIGEKVFWAEQDINPYKEICRLII